MHGLEDPHPDDWKEYVEALRESTKSLAATLLVVTDGPGPSAVQRDMLKEMAPGSLRTAVVTGSSVARGIVTLLSWFHDSIRAYAPAEIDRAFDYLTVADSERPLILKTVAALRAQLSGIGVASELEAAAMLQETAIAPMEAVVARLSSLRSQLAGRRR